MGRFCDVVVGRWQSIFGGLGGRRRRHICGTANQLLLHSRISELATTLETTSTGLEAAVSMLVYSASGQSNANLESAGRTSDQGRVLLAVISIASVIAATLASWLWVGQWSAQSAFSLV